MINKEELKYFLKFLSLNGKIGLDDIILYVNNTSCEDISKDYRVWKSTEPNAPDITIDDNLDWYSILSSDNS